MIKEIGSSSEWGRSKFSIEIESDDQGKLDAIRSCLLGAHYIIGNKEHDIDVFPRFHEITLERDPEIAPHFTRVNQGSLESYEHERSGKTRQNGAIYVQHLMGYSGTDDAYVAKASILESCGFCCMRSRRNRSGRYWEIWYLPDVILGEGPIKDMNQNQICQWILSNIRPGCVSLEGESWGLTID